MITLNSKSGCILQDSKQIGNETIATEQWTIHKTTYTKYNNLCNFDQIKAHKRYLDRVSNIMLHKRYLDRVNNMVPHVSHISTEYSYLQSTLTLSNLRHGLSRKVSVRPKWGVAVVIIYSGHD